MCTGIHPPTRLKQTNKHLNNHTPTPTSSHTHTHTQFDRSNYMAAIKVLGVYIFEVAKLGGPKPSSCRCEPTAVDMSLPGAFSKGFRCKCEI